MELGKIYVNQTAVKLIITTGVDFLVNELSSAKIKLINTSLNNALLKEWDANLLNPPGSDGKLYVDFDDTKKFDTAGIWKIWVEVVFSNNKKAFSKPFLYKVDNEGGL